MKTEESKTKTAYVVIDTHNGLFDGFYFDVDLAKDALQHWKSIEDKWPFRMNLMIAEVSQEQINDGIADEKFMATAWHKALNAYTNGIADEKFMATAWNKALFSEADQTNEPANTIRPGNTNRQHGPNL